MIKGEFLGNWFGRLGQVVPAFATKLKIGRIGILALWTDYLKFSAAFHTKFHSFRILRLAFRAFHFLLP
jgi:hypothetical protein